MSRYEEVCCEHICPVNRASHLTDVLIGHCFEGLLKLAHLTALQLYYLAYLESLNVTCRVICNLLSVTYLLVPQKYKYSYHSTQYVLLKIKDYAGATVQD